MQQSRAFRDDISERGLRPLRRPLACHRTNTVNDVSSPSRIIDDALEDLLHPFEVGFRLVQPAQCSLTAGQYRRKGLIYLVRNRCRQCSEANDPAYMRQLRSNLVARIFRKPASCNVLSSTKTFQSPTLVAHRTRAHPEILDPTIWHPQPQFVIRVGKSRTHPLSVVIQPWKVVRMGAFTKHISGDLRTRLELPDALELVRKRDLLRSQIPRESAGQAYRLTFGEVEFTSLEPGFCLRTLYRDAGEMGNVCDGFLMMQGRTARVFLIDANGANDRLPPVSKSAYSKPLSNRAPEHEPGTAPRSNVGRIQYLRRSPAFFR